MRYNGTDTGTQKTVTYNHFTKIVLEKYKS